MPTDRCSAVTATLLAILSVATTTLCAQSLADVAKREEERRKTEQPATKVYTNKDLAPVPPSSAPPPAAADASGSAPDKDAKDAAAGKDGKDAQGATSATSATSGKSAKDDTDASPGKKGGQGADKGQAYWADRQRSLQEALDRDSTYVEALQSRINALTTDFTNRDDPAQRAVIERDRQKALSEHERLTKQVQDDHKAIADFEEEARRAGVPPGWLR